jgi:S-adenosylmethionine-dependent methyltransferase
MPNMSLKSSLKDLIFSAPPSLRKNHRPTTSNITGAMRESLAEHYHVGARAKSQYTPELFQHDLTAHVQGRLKKDRNIVVPWLAATRPLKGLRILEIGCGTGSSTVALAEQGAHVTGIDIDEGSLVVARRRLNAYGLDADLHATNITDFDCQGYDLIIFFASLEHMTYEERLSSLSQTWAALPKNGLLAVIETPNRLWWHDAHTSKLPFFNWLPDTLAFDYSKYSPKSSFNGLYREHSPAQMMHFLRRGRGASFHEFDLAIGSSLNVVSSLSSYRGWLKRIRVTPLDRQYQSFLKRALPHMHSAWTDRDLDLVIKKP